MEFRNPYRPGAGHMPPHLAGREYEYGEFDRLLTQDSILENLVLTGLRGVGKTVLLETFKPRAMAGGWLWVGTDLSESASVNETTLAQRLLADLSVVTSTITLVDVPQPRLGFAVPQQAKGVALSYDVLTSIYDGTPGLVADRIKAVLLFAAEQLSRSGQPRVIFAYDEAQNLADNSEKQQYPLSVVLDVFQTIQRADIPFMLVLTGLPTLFPKLVDARTYSERMFRVVTLGRLDEGESREAILRPLDQADCPVRFSEEAVTIVTHESGGYPYFIQFICREVYDVYIQQAAANQKMSVPVDAIQRKLDTDFFSGRWARVTDRQRQLLWAIATMDASDGEFTIQELVAHAKDALVKAFSPSHTNQMLVSLAQQGLIYKNRFGRYSFAVPLLGTFIRRTYEPPRGERSGDNPS